MTQRCVRATEPRTASRSNGRSVRGSITVASMPSFASSSAAFVATKRIFCQATMVTSPPWRTTSAWPNGMSSSPSSTSPFDPYSTSDSMKTIGSSSRMAVLRSPFASRGVAGTATLSPGMYA